MGNIKENILVNFSRKSKYTSDTSFVGIKFGADAQLTELELIELQEILRGQITSSLKNLIGDKFLKEKPECIYADKVITLKKGKMLIQGYYAEADNLVLKDVVNGDYIAVKGEIVEIKHSDNIPKWGNNSEASNIVILPNYIQDEDLKGETSRRYQLVFKLVKVKPDSQGEVDGLLVGHIVNGKLILDAPVADFDSLDKDITEVGDILRKELRDLQEDLSMHKNDASRIEREIREILENYSTTLNGYTEEHNKIHIELDKVLKTKINESDAIKLIDEHAKLKKEIVEVLPNPLDAKPNTIYLVKKEDGKDGDFYNEYVIIDKKFELIGNTSLDLTGYAKKTDIPERLGQLEDDLKLQESIKGLSDGKVDKVTGKQLSTNDYTTTEKNKLSKLNNYDDTDIKADISKKVDKVEGKQLSTNDYSTEEKNKLSKLNNYDDTNIKADIAKKADTSIVNTNLAKKVDKVVGKGLSTNDYDNTEKAEVAKVKNKADTTYVNNGLNNKADKTELNKKIDKTSITSDLEGTDENKVLSQKAGSLLFQSVNDGKGYIANSIIDLNGDVNVSNESTFTELGDAITNNLTKAPELIYGFEINEGNSNPATAVTYIGDNIGYTPMKVSNYGNWKNFIRKISTPVLLKGGKVQYELQHDDFTKRVDGVKSILTGADGDVMIRFKHLWVKEEKVSSTKRKVYLSAEKFDGAVSYTKMTEKGYNQLSWGLLMTLQHLYLLLYKDRDSQTALGRGYVDRNSDFANTGGTNTKPYFFGETTGKQQMKFCGIESFWGNKCNFVDGIVSDSNYDLKIGYTNFNDSGSGYKLIKTSMTDDVIGYFKSTVSGEAGYILTDDAGSSSTGYCDYGVVSKGKTVKVAYFGGYRSDGNDAGAFGVWLGNSAPTSDSYYGARLCFVDDDYFYVGAYTGYVEGSKLRSISGKVPTGDKTIGEFRTYAK